MLTNQTLAEILRKPAGRVFLILRWLPAFGSIWSGLMVAAGLVSICEKRSVYGYAHEEGA